MSGMPGDMPNSVLDLLNAEFGPGFVFDETIDETTRYMWSNAYGAAELASDELDLTDPDDARQTDINLSEYATQRVVDAWKVLLWGSPLKSQ